MADRPAHLLRDVRLHHLRAPPAVVGLHQVEHEVVQEAREHGLLGLAFLQRIARALQDVVADPRRAAQPDEIDQRRLVRHGRERGERNTHTARARAAEQRSGAAAHVPGLPHAGPGGRWVPFPPPWPGRVGSSRKAGLGSGYSNPWWRARTGLMSRTGRAPAPPPPRGRAPPRPAPPPPPPPMTPWTTVVERPA